MNFLDHAIAAIAPRWAFRRKQWRSLASYYESSRPSRYRNTSFANPSGDTATYNNLHALRAVARDLERNHDIARGALNVLVAHTIGTGIGIEPQPRLRDGKTIDNDLADQIRALWTDWTVRPEVTWEHDWAQAQRLMARSWFRDGEVLAQHVSGTRTGLNHGTKVPYSIEMIEADLLADYHIDMGAGIFQGLERNEWGRPRAYWLYKGYPSDFYIIPKAQELKRVTADRIMHLKSTDRIRQARGVSVFASVFTRLQDLKDYEESERIAAKVAASMAAVIKKGSPDLYEPSPTDDGKRDIKFSPGMVFDDMRPGESIETIDTTRPNSELGTYRDNMLRAAASGIGVGASSISKNYNGSYSAQRQEMVEQWSSYAILSTHFVASIYRPAYQRFIALAIGAGLLKIPRDVDVTTITDALYIPPQMPWIDPLKEATAWSALDAAGYASAPEIIRRRGQNPSDVLEQRKAWERRGGQSAAPASVPASPPPASQTGHRNA